MMHEEVAKYRKLSGDTNPNTPISRIGGYLDGYEKALEQEPCDDAISRQAVLELVADYDLSMGQVVRGIHALPPVTQAPKTGHWIETDGGDAYWYMCSECHRRADDKSDYCPNCGARMIEPQERSEEE